MERERPRVELTHTHCPYCKDSVRPDEDKEACHSCMAWHHAECWTTHGGCSACLTATAATAPAANDLTRCFRESCAEPVHLTPLPRDYRVDHGGERVHMGRLCAKHAVAGLEGYAVTTEGVGAVFLALTIFSGVLAVLSQRVHLLFGPLVLGIIAAVFYVAHTRYRKLMRKIAED
jgi:hypothetical protein